MSNIKLSEVGFQLVTLQLLVASSPRTIDLAPYFVELNFFEDIFSPTISGQLVISDAVGLTTNFRMNGTEFVEISFKKFPEDPTVYHRVFRVYKISNKKLDSSTNHESYVLNLVSEEFVLSEQYRISKSFKGTQISDIVKSILTDYLKVGTGNKKKIYVEPTDGVYDFILPNKKLFETISWLSNYALPRSKNTGADMLFFENAKGYQFTSLQTLYKQPSYTKYFYNPKNTSNDMESKIKNVREFDVLDFFDTLGGVSKGSFSNRLITIDPLTKFYKVTDFDYNKYVSQKTTSTLNKYPPVAAYKDREGKMMHESPDVTNMGLEAGTLRMATSNSNQKKKVLVPDAVGNDIFIERFMPNRVAQLGLANYMRIKITVPGNNELTVGMAIDFSIPNVMPTNQTGQGREEDVMFSGKYIITAVRHMIKSGTPTTFVTVLELAKDSITGPLPSPGNMSSWKDAIEGTQKDV